MSEIRYAVVLQDGQEPVVENGRKVLYLSPDQVGTLYRQQPYAFRTIPQDIVHYICEWDMDLLEENGYEYFTVEGHDETLACKIGNMMDPSDPLGNERNYWKYIHDALEEFFSDFNEEDEDEDEDENEDDDECGVPLFELDLDLFESYPR